MTLPTSKARFESEYLLQEKTAAAKIMSEEKREYALRWLDTHLEQTKDFDDVRQPSEDERRLIHDVLTEHQSMELNRLIGTTTRE